MKNPLSFIYVDREDTDQARKMLDAQSKKDAKDQETIESSSTPDPGYHMGK